MASFFYLSFALLHLASGLSITKFQNDVTVSSDQGTCVSQVTFDSDPNVPITVNGCVGLEDQSSSGVTLHCDGNNCGRCGSGCGGNECGCGIFVSYMGQQAFVTYDKNTETCNLPGGTPGDGGDCLQREGSGYPIAMST